MVQYRCDLMAQEFQSPIPRCIEERWEVWAARIREPRFSSWRQVASDERGDFRGVPVAIKNIGAKDQVEFSDPDRFGPIGKYPVDQAIGNPEMAGRGGYDCEGARLAV